MSDAAGAELPPLHPFSVHLHQTFRSLRHRNYRLFFYGQLVSVAGSWVQGVAQQWLVYTLTDSPNYLGLVGALGSAPMLVLSPLGGVLADRFEKRRLILFTQAAMALLAGVLAVLTLTHHVHIRDLLILSLLGGIVNALDIPARQAFVVEMVGKDDLVNAIALNSTMFNLARMIGPGLAGLLLVWVDLGGCFLLNALSFLAVIGALWAMDMRPLTGHVEVPSLLAHLREGFGCVRRHPVVGPVIGLLAVFSAFGFSYGVLMPVFARDILHVGVRGLAFLQASTGLGALVGALSLASQGQRQRTPRRILAGATVFLVLVLLFAWVPSYPVDLVLLAGIGYATIQFVASANTLVQTSVADTIRGRVMGVYGMAFIGMGPVGSLTAGWLTSVVGAPTALTLGAVICAGCVAKLWRDWPAVRRRT